MFRKLRSFYGRHNRPTEQSIQLIVTKLRTSFTLLDINPPNRTRRVRTEGNIAAALGLCYSTTWKILRKDLGLKPYKIQLLQELKPGDLP